MSVRKCNLNEMENIIKLADKCFISNRDKGFSFVNAVPHIYSNSNHDYSDIHFFAENEKGIVGIGANLISNITLENNLYKISRVGTIGTLPKYRNKGYMKEIMDYIEKENIENNVIFSVLSGDRNRYKNFGYEKACLTCNCVYKKSQIKYLEGKYNIDVREYKVSDLDKIYDIYLDNNKLILREKDDFEVHLNNDARKLYTITLDNNVIGYYSIKENNVNEICLEDNKYLESIMCCLLKNNEYEEINVYANILNKDLFKQLSSNASYKCLMDKWSIKVYNFERFIKFLYLINKDKFSDNKYKEVYKIDNEIYEFKINKNNINVSKTNKKPLKEFKDKYEFLRFALGVDLLYNESKIFPLFFDFNLGDKI